MNLQVHGRLRSHQRNALFPPDPAITPTNPLRCKTKFRSATDISRWFNKREKAYGQDDKIKQDGNVIGVCLFL